MEPVSHIVLHVDMDSFYASVEVRDHPDLRGKPVVIGADPLQGRGRGVVVTASYEARAYGIHSAMPISRAYRLCPSAIFLRPNFPLYLDASRRIMDLVRSMADACDQVSVDEAYLLFRHAPDFSQARLLAEGIRHALLRSEHLSCSVGGGPSRIVAKIASDHAKPGGICVVSPDDVPAFLNPLPVERLPGIGEKSRQALERAGITRIGELASSDPAMLVGLFGRGAHSLVSRAKGEDDRPWCEGGPGGRIRSVSREVTFDHDTADPREISETLDDLASVLARELPALGVWPRTVTVKIRTAGFLTRTRSHTYRHAPRDPCLIQETARQLARDIWDGAPLRLIGIRLSSLGSKAPDQQSLDDFLKCDVAEGDG